VRRFDSRAARRPMLDFASAGVLASLSVLIAWEFVKRTGGTAESGSWLLLEFLTTFLVTFGAAAGAALLLGVFGRRPRRS